MLHIECSKALIFFNQNSITLLSLYSRYEKQLALSGSSVSKITVKEQPKTNGLSTGRVVLAMSILMILVFSKNMYVAAISSYYSFFARERFGVTMEQEQIILFVFLLANVVGLLLGGWLTDRFSDFRQYG